MVKKLHIKENEERSYEDQMEYYKGTLRDMNNKELVKHLEQIVIQNYGRYGEYNDMISAIEEELLNRM